MSRILQKKVIMFLKDFDAKVHHAKSNKILNEQILYSATIKELR